MSIGGQLNYAVLAQQHRPADPYSLRAEVRRLADTGLRARDIAEALKIPLHTAIELLRWTP